MHCHSRGGPMLKFWRRRSKTFVVHVVFWPIIAVFVIWGFERFGNPVGSAAAVVNNHTITMTEYRNALQRMVDFYSQLLQGNFDEDAQKRYHVRESALRQLISNALIADEADAIGLKVTDDEVTQTITDIPALKKDGRFSRENYDALLRYYHMSPPQFEDGLRRDTLIDKTRRFFDQNLPRSRAESEKEQALRSQKIDIEFLKIDLDGLGEKVSVASDQVQNFLKDPVHERQIKEYYDLHRSQYSHPEETRARHILVKAKKGDKAEETAALDKISKIQGELKQKSFEDLAKKYSDDPGTKGKGGDLGWFAIGRMVPEFEKAAQALKEGQVSAPVQTAFGYHLIKVEGRRPAHATSFEEARPEIAKILLGHLKVEDAVAEAEKAMATHPAEAIKELEKLDRSVKWEETGFFSLNDETIPKIGENEELAVAAFSLTKEKPMPSKLFKNGSLVYALRFKKSEAAASADSAKIPGQEAQDSARGLFMAWSSKLFEKAKIKTNPQLFSGEASESQGDF